MFISSVFGSALLAMAAQQGGDPAFAETPGPVPLNLYCPADNVLGVLPNGSTVGSYQVPEEINGRAAWLLVHVQMYTGNVQPNGPRTYRIASERRPYRRFSHLFYHWGYPGAAVNSTSNDYWLPAPEGGHLQISLESGAPFASGSRGSQVRLIGYIGRRGGEDCHRLPT